MWMATCRSGFETVVVKRCPFMQSERESGGFLQCKKHCIHYIGAVNKVHRLAVGVGSYGVSEVSTRAGE